jgi:hypothetical protein
VVDFIEEVEEQLRAERYRTLAQTYVPWFVAALAAAVVGWLGVWGYQAWQGGMVAKASTVYDKGLTALTQNDMAGAFADFETAGRAGPPGYRTLALMQQGNIRLIAGKTDEAVTFYDAAAKAAPSPILGDLARLKAALALLDTAPYAQVATRLTALIGDKKPYDLKAREALAMAKLAAGKTAEARAAFSNLTITLGVSQEMRQRAFEAMALIDSGEAKTVVAAAAAAATLPPPSAASMGPAQAGPPPGAEDDPQAAADPRNAQ